MRSSYTLSGRDVALIVDYVLWARLWALSVGCSNLQAGPIIVYALFCSVAAECAVLLMR